MRSLQLSSSNKGGAGLAAYRLSEALNENGCESQFLSREVLDSRFEIATPIFYMRQFLSKTLTVFQKPGFISNGTLITPFSVDFVTELQKVADFQEYDVVQIHSFFNFLSHESIRRIAEFSRSLVITLHDERFFTGACHYTMGCAKFQTNCQSCPQAHKWAWSVIHRNQQSSRNIFKTLDQANVRFVAPSKWILSQLIDSELISHAKVERIYNPIPMCYFQQKFPMDGREDNTLRIGFIASHLDNPYKGINTLLSAASILQRNNYPFELRLAGQFMGKFEHRNYKVEISLNEGDDQTISFLDGLDVLVVPSLSDNLPNVLLEAFSRGKPVIGSETGGIAELLREFDMPLFPPGNAEMLARELLHFRREKYSREKIRKKARELFSYSSVASQYMKLYKSMN